MWFFKKKAIEAVCFELHDVVVRVRLDGYINYASQAFGCSSEQLEQAVARHWSELETGKVRPEQFWDLVGASLKELGVAHSTSGSRFRGIWEGVVSDSAQVDSEVLNTVRQVKDLKFRTVASANLTQELSLIYQKLGVFEPFSLTCISSRIGERKPTPNYFNRMKKLALTSPSCCLYVDKDEQNLKAAKSAGFQTLTFTSVGDARRELIERGVLH